MQVVLIQACQVAANHTLLRAQSDEEAELDAPTPSCLPDLQRDQHITLTRHHTVLLLATVRGGIAYRGAFTGAMADEFRAADGRKDIYEMFRSAVDNMRKSRYWHKQCPEFRSTLRRSLVLPASSIMCCGKRASRR